MKEPLPFLLKKFLRDSKIKINEEELTFQLRSHPSYPSLHSVTGVLDHFAIKNYALEVPRSLEVLEKLPTIFLAFVESREYKGLGLVNKIGKECRITFDDKSYRTISFEGFLEMWSGIVVIIDEENEGVISHNSENILIGKNLLLITVVILAALFFYGTSLYSAIHFSLSLAGIFVCVLILYHELGFESRLVDKICTQATEKTSCDAVLTSKGATLMKFFKLSDVGIIYFISIVLSWIMLKQGNLTYVPIALISLLALPFTLYSIYYQYAVVKKWCPLCLSVVAILWLQAASLLFTKITFNESIFDIKSITVTALCFLATFSVWQFISPKLRKEKELNTLKIDHYKFKLNFNIYKALTSGTDRLDTRIDDDKEIVIQRSGEPSLINVVIVTNPLCGFCKEAHALVEKLLEIEEKGIRVTVRFNVNDDHASIDSRIAQRLLEIYNNNSKQECLDALHDIYGKITPKDWLSKWNEPVSNQFQGTLLAEKEWCRQQGINFTPEILVNGWSFPREYDRMDLLFFIDDLFEEEAEQIRNQVGEPDFATS
ncbi:MAG: vitamin K epoxide reductase family protein [Bacteroidales bacterium]